MKDFYQHALEAFVIFPLTLIKSSCFRTLHTKVIIILLCQHHLLYESESMLTLTQLLTYLHNMNG